MHSSTANAYLRTKVTTASPADLRLMLLDGAIKFAGQARAGLERRDYEAAYNGISRCQSILMELIDALRPEHGPEVCRNLSALYTFLYTRLIAASHGRDAAILDEVLRLLEYERQTWQMLIDKLAAENTAAGGLAHTPDARPPLPADPNAQADIVGGSVSVRG